MSVTSPAAAIVDLIKGCNRDEAIALVDCALIVARGQGVAEGLKRGYEAAQATVDEVLKRHVALTS